MGSPSEAGDAELVEAARAGEPDAFGQLAARWFDRCYDVALGVVRNPDDAAEVTQDSLIKAWQRLDQLEDGAAFGGWLLRITRNGALDRLRRESRSRPVDAGVMVGMHDQGAPDPDGTRRTPDEGDPANTVVDADRDAIIGAAAVALGESDASLLGLHLRHGLTPAEIADELGVSPNVAQQRLFRMRERLGTAIGGLALWRRGEPSCPVLADLVASFPVFDAEALRVVEEHRKNCDECSRRRAALIAPHTLFSALPVAAIPLALRARVVDGLAAAGVPTGGLGASGAAGAAQGGGASGSGEGGAGGGASGSGTAGAVGGAAAGAGVAAGVAAGVGAAGGGASGSGAAGATGGAAAGASGSGGGGAASGSGGGGAASGVSAGLIAVVVGVVAVAAVALAGALWLGGDDSGGESGVDVSGTSGDVTIAADDATEFGGAAPAGGPTGPGGTDPGGSDPTGTGDPADSSLSAGASSTTTSVLAPPATSTPATGPPVTDRPVTRPPATDPPVTDPPVTRPPATDPPATDPPVTDPPVTSPPVTDPPVTDPPVTTAPGPGPEIVIFAASAEAVECADPDEIGWALDWVSVRATSGVLVVGGISYEVPPSGALIACALPGSEATLTVEGDRGSATDTIVLG